MWSPAQRCLIGFLVTLLPFSLTPAAEWDGEPWADYSPFMTPITLPTKQNLLGIKSTGDTLGRIPGRMGQIGDSISNPGAFFRNAVLFPVLANETGHDYAPIRSWLAYSGTQPADMGAFYFALGNGPDYGCDGGWRVLDAVAAGHPVQGVEIGNGEVPGAFSWATIMFGTNDIDLQSWDPAAWKIDLKDFVTDYIDLGVIPVLSTIPPEGAHIGDGRVDLANDVIKSVAFELTIPYIDYHALILHHHPDDWLGTLISADGTHPSVSSFGREFSQDALSNTDGFATRSKLSLDIAEKLLSVVFENEAAEPKRSLALEHSADSLTWNRLPYATWYDVVVGDLEALRSAGGSFGTATDACVVDDTRALSIDEPTDPPPGEGVWFLVRAVVNGISGSYGTGVAPRDTHILASGHDCPQ